MFAEYSGNFYNGEISENYYNSLTLYWEYKEKTSDIWTYGGVLTSTKTDNTFIGSETLGNVFDYRKSYDFNVYVQDLLSINYYNANVSVGIPYFDYGVDSNGDNYFNINGNLYIKDEAFSNKAFIRESSTSLDKSISSGSWQTIRTGYTEHLTSGKYLIIFAMSITSSTSGIATLRYTLNGSEIDGRSRSTVPITNLVSTAQVTEILNIATEDDYVFALQTYTSVAATVSAISMKLIKL